MAARRAAGAASVEGQQAPPEGSTAVAARASEREAAGVVEEASVAGASVGVATAEAEKAVA